MFTVEEAQALVACVRMAQVWQDPAMAQASQEALGKMLSALPTASRAAALSMAVCAARWAGPRSTGDAAHPRQATQARQEINAQYTDASGGATRRILRPPGCFYWGKVWTLAAWCELRDGFRSFAWTVCPMCARSTARRAITKTKQAKPYPTDLRHAAPPGVHEKLDGTS